MAAAFRISYNAIMRIIAGEFKGRQYTVRSGSDFRPACEKVRKSLFDILGDSVRGRVVLDLFAGTGSVGMEALSRGASRVYFVERDRQSVSGLKRVIAEWGLAGRATVIPGDAERAVARLPQPADLINADPPYNYRRWAELLAALSPPAVAPDAHLIIETGSKESLPPLAGWELTDTRLYGGTTLRFYRRRAATAPESAPC